MSKKKVFSVTDAAGDLCDAIKDVLLQAHYLAGRIKSSRNPVCALKLKALVAKLPEGLITEIVPKKRERKAPKAETTSAGSPEEYGGPDDAETRTV